MNAPLSPLSSPQSPLALLYDLIRPHPTIQKPDERHRAELIAALTLSFSLIILLGSIFTLTMTGWNLLTGMGFLFGIISGMAYFLSRGPFYQQSAWLLIFGFLPLAYAAVFLGEYPSLFVILTFSILFLLSNLLEWKWMPGVVILNVISIVLLGLIFLRLPQIEAWNTYAGVITLALFTLLFAWHRNNLERLRLGEVLQAQAALEERNRALQIAQEEVRERLVELQLAAEVGRAVSQVRRLDEMLTDAVERIRAQFDLYYTQVYLVNPARTYLVLAAGTGEAGKTLLARRHQLPLDRNSLNGRAALDKTPVVVADTAQNPAFKPNPLLPDTRSEMAIPLIVGETVVGVLDMQSRYPGKLNQQILPAFQALASQLAIAIQNARLLEEAQAARAEVETQARRLTRTYWQEYLDSIHRPERWGYVFENDQVRPLDEAQPLPSSPSALNLPLAVGGEPIGSIVVEIDESLRTPHLMELLDTVARQVADHLESLRLLETAERYRLQAEAAIRRLTREGWEEYFRRKQKAGQTLACLYDQREVKSLELPALNEMPPALSIPLQVGEVTIGQVAVLDLDSPDPDTVDLVNTVAQRLADHLESLRLLEETQRSQLELDKRAQRLAAVSEIATTSARETDLNRMLEMVVHLTQRKFGLYHAHVFLYNEAARQLEIVACGWEEGSPYEGTHGTRTIPIQQEPSLVARAARTRAPVVVNDVYSDPDWLPNPLLPRTAAELAVPLLVGETLLGVLDVQSDQINAFTEEEINIMMTLAAQIATALQNARNYERARKQAEREALLNAISQKIQSATSVEAVLQIAARELGHALRAPLTIAQLSLMEGDGNI